MKSGLKSVEVDELAEETVEFHSSSSQKGAGLMSGTREIHADLTFSSAGRYRLDRLPCMPVDRGGRYPDHIPLGRGKRLRRRQFSRKWEARSRWSTGLANGPYRSLFGPERDASHFCQRDYGPSFGRKITTTWTRCDSLSA